MKTLKLILNLKNDIEDLAEECGFMREVRVLYHVNKEEEKKEGEQILNFLVKSNPEQYISYKAPEALIIKLIELTSCEVGIIDHEAVSTLYKQVYLKESATLDESALEQLFGKNLSLISLKEHNKLDKLFVLASKEAANFLAERKASHFNYSNLPTN